MNQLQSVTSATPTNGTMFCPSKKKYFHSREEAETWQKQNEQKYPNTVHQNAYACEQCDGFHLSTLDPAAFSIGRSSLAMAESKAPAYKRGGRLSEEDRNRRISDVENLRRKNPLMKVTQMARELCTGWGVNENVAYAWIYGYINPEKSISQPKVETLDTIAAKRRFLEEQLKALQTEEQRLLDEKKFKLLPCWDGRGVLIKKEQNQMALLLEDAYELADKLVDYLASQKVEAATASEVFNN